MDYFIYTLRKSTILIVITCLLNSSVTFCIEAEEKDEEKTISIWQKSFGLDSSTVRDYLYNFVNLLLNFVGVLVHQVILQIFLT